MYGICLKLVIAVYSNGKDLRNKYIHSTYPMDEDVQMQDYMDLLKIMIIIMGKINEEFLIKCLKVMRTINE